MEEIEKETEEVTELIEEEPPYKKEPRQNYVIYTVISVILFFILYFGVNFVTGKINAEYYMTVDGSQLTDEQKGIISDYASIDCTDITAVKLKRVNRSSVVTVYFENTGDPETFAEERIMFEYGDVVEDLRIEIFPYGNETVEFVYASSYVNIDNPNVYCHVYEFNGENYAEYHSDELTSEISALFMDAEKIYL